MPHPPPRRIEAGYSLVETLLAAGLLAFILVSVSGLFVVGGQNVRSGRELTKATTIANSAMEQVLSWNYDKVYAFAGGAATDQTKTWDTSQANPAYSGTSSDVADWTATANAWRTELAQQVRGGKLTYKVDGVARLPVTGNPGLTTFQDAQFLRVTITVEWSERAKRRRSVTFEEFVL
jgi:type II secretory pathway pseudopilin PulG